MGSSELRAALNGELFPDTLLASADVQQLLHTVADVLEQSEIALFWKDRDGKFLGANEVFCRVCGLDNPKDIVGKTDFELFTEDVAAGFSRDDIEVMETGIPILDFAEQVEAADGRVETLHTSKVPVRDTDGEVIAMMGCFHVVTTVAETEQALRTLEGRYAVALDASRDGMWELDLKTDELEVSQRFIELIDLKLTPRNGTRFDYEQILEILGDAQDSFRDEVQTLIRDRTPIDSKHDYQMPDGSTRWFNISGLPLVDENDRISHVIGTLVDITEQVQRERDLVFQAGHDDLTGLHNRRSLLHHLAIRMSSQDPFSLLYLDLDEFKLVNDSLGHFVGDDLLGAMAERLSDLMLPGQMIARLGGDEFAIVAANTTPVEAEELGQQVIDALSESLVLNETEIYITCSVGIVHSSERYGSALELLRDGDIALYRAKQDGKSCVRVFEDSMRLAADEALNLQNQIRGAVERKEFVMRYQPIFDSKTGLVSGVESLIRWEHQSGEVLTAGAFLPYLERTGLMVKVGEWVIRESIGQLARWRDEYPLAHDWTLSVNLSRIQFRSSRLRQLLVDTLAVHKIPNDRLIVEVTETAIADSLEIVVQTLDELQRLGIRVAIDDFGVGQSSLSSLHDLPLDILKIDQSFIARIGQGKSEQMIDTMVAIAASADLVTTAEGVTTEAQRKYLEMAGCEQLQGFLLGMPETPDNIARQFLDDVEMKAA